jgi:hypothetical protein
MVVMVCVIPRRQTDPIALAVQQQRSDHQPVRTYNDEFSESGRGNGRAPGMLVAKTFAEPPRVAARLGRGPQDLASALGAGRF